MSNPNNQDDVFMAQNAAFARDTTRYTKR